jgi:CheY-like chemotaxis protein
MTGYRGRFSIMEVLAMNSELERRIGQAATADHIADAARANGMRSLFDSGLRHVLAGESSLEELLRVTDVPQEEQGAKVRRERPPGRPQAAAAPPAQPATPAASPATTPGASLDFAEALELVDDVAADEAAGEGGRGAGTCVLLVEDEDQLRRVMKDLLERDGYTVAEARDGVQALDQVDRFAPDVIILDLNLPGLDGYSVLAQLRSRPATRSIPVMVLTAKGDEDNEVRVFELGADDFITKPFRARALSARLEAVLGRHRA